MEFKAPKSKKHAPAQKNFPLPLTEEKQLVGIFNGQNVTVSDWDSMMRIYHGGNFGKGSLSKGAPTYHVKKDDIPRIILQQQFENQVKWKPEIRYSCLKKYSGFLKNSFELSVASVDNFLQSSFNDDRQESWKTWKKRHKGNSTQYTRSSFMIGNKNSDALEFSTEEKSYIDESFKEMVNEILESKQGKKLKILPTKTEEEVIVVNDDSDVTNLSVAKCNPILKRLTYLAEENLSLNLEESFFLKFTANCLNIIDLNYSELSPGNLWKEFNKVQQNFTERYVVYHYYRTKGWVVKSGLKFGGDYLLYKDGPSFQHSSYLIHVLDRRKKMSSWRDFIARNRLVETFNKDLILCDASSPIKTPLESFPDCLKSYSVQEVLTRRWFPSKERFSKEDSSTSWQSLGKKYK